MGEGGLKGVERSRALEESDLRFQAVPFDPNKPRVNHPQGFSEKPLNNFLKVSGIDIINFTNGKITSASGA